MSSLSNPVESINKYNNFIDFLSQLVSYSDFAIKYKHKEPTVQEFCDYFKKMNYCVITFNRALESTINYYVKENKINVPILKDKTNGNITVCFPAKMQKEINGLCDYIKSKDKTYSIEGYDLEKYVELTDINSDEKHSINQINKLSLYDISILSQSLSNEKIYFNVNKDNDGYYLSYCSADKDAVNKAIAAVIAGKTGKLGEINTAIFERKEKEFGEIINRVEKGETIYISSLDIPFSYLKINKEGIREYKRRKEEWKLTKEYPEIQTEKSINQLGRIILCYGNFSVINEEEFNKEKLNEILLNKTPKYNITEEEMGIEKALQDVIYRINTVYKQDAYLKDVNSLKILYEKNKIEKNLKGAKKRLNDSLEKILEIWNKNEEYCNEYVKNYFKEREVYKEKMEENKEKLREINSLSRGDFQ